MTDYAPYKKMFRENHGILRASTARKMGVPHHVIYEMAAMGELIREGQGIYRLKESAPLSNPDLVQVSLRARRAVICLISALYYHDLTTQIPHRICFALPREVKTPKISYPPTWVFHYSDESYKSGVEEHSIDGVKVRIYAREKTVADCFKFRSKVGADVALEALKDYLRQPKPNIALLVKYAKVNRVEKVMRPYVEALL
jgi:predicted transcriptional regulator of viral defense system